MLVRPALLPVPSWVSLHHLESLVVAFLHAAAQAFSFSTNPIVTILMVVEPMLCSDFRRFSNTG